MLTSKQRAQLRSMANDLPAVFQVGKGGINDQLIRQTDELLDLRELIKLSVLETSGMTARQAADEIGRATSANVVQVIGRKFVLYRKSRKKENVKIVLVK